jgi:hypothetical protein
MKSARLIICCAMIFLQQAMLGQLPVSIQKVKLPGSIQYRDIYVSRSGNDFLMNGDIIVDQHNKNAAMQGNTEGNYLWPKGYIPVEIEDSIFMFGFQGSLYAAIDFLNTNTRVRFKPRTNESDYIYVDYKSVMEMGFSGGSSWVGRHGGRQGLNLSTSNYSTILHELMHAIGFWHEQSRPDRDSYVQILWDNIDSELSKHNFQIESGTTIGAYDYASIMHYFSTAFAKQGKVTLKCKSGDKVSDCTMGNNTLSTNDILAVNGAYWFNASIQNISFRTEYEQKRQSAELRKNMGALQKGKINRSISPLENGLYKIKVNHTGKYLAIEGISKENGARLVQWDYISQPNHHFNVRSIGNGYFEISASHSNRFLNASGQSKVDGTPIIQWDFANQDNVKWRIYYSEQIGNPGWVMESKGAAPIRLSTGLTATNNGDPFVLMLPKRVDANEYESFQTFTFEKIGEVKMTERGLYENSPGMKPGKMK